MYNDNYVTPTKERNGLKWIIIQDDRLILQQRRKELGYTQQQVADMAKIQLRQYQRFENGERSMASSSLRIGLSICAVLELDPYRFVGRP